MSDPSQIPNIHAPLPSQQGNSKNQPIDSEKFKREMQKVQAVDSSQEGQKRNKRNLSKQQEGDEEEIQAQPTPVAGVFEELLKVSTKKPVDFTISDKDNLTNLYQKLSSTSTEDSLIIPQSTYESPDFQQQVNNSSSADSSEFFFIPSSSNDLQSPPTASDTTSFSNQQVSEILTSTDNSSSTFTQPPSNDLQSSTSSFNTNNFSNQQSSDTEPNNDDTSYSFTPTPSNNLQSLSTISLAAPNLNNELDITSPSILETSATKNLPIQEESLINQSLTSLTTSSNGKKEKKPISLSAKKLNDLKKPEEPFIELPTITTSIDKKESLTTPNELKKFESDIKNSDEKYITNTSTSSNSKTSKSEDSSNHKELIQQKKHATSSVSSPSQFFAKPKQKKEELKKPEHQEKSTLLPNDNKLHKSKKIETTTKQFDKELSTESTPIEKKSNLTKPSESLFKEPLFESKQEDKPSILPSFDQSKEQKIIQSKSEKKEVVKSKKPAKNTFFNYEEPELSIEKPSHDLTSIKTKSSSKDEQFTFEKNELFSEKDTYNEPNVKSNTPLQTKDLFELPPENLVQTSKIITPTSTPNIEKSKEKISSIDQSSKKRTSTEDTSEIAAEDEEISIIQPFLQNLPAAPVQELPPYSRLSPETFELFQRMIGTMTIQKEGGVSTTIITINNPNSNFNNSQLILEHYDTAPNSFNVEFQGNITQMNLFNDNITDLVAAIQQARLNYSVNIKRASLKPDHRIVERKQDTSKEQN